MGIVASTNKTANIDEYTREIILGIWNFNDIFSFGKIFSITYLRTNISNNNNKIEKKLHKNIINTKKDNIPSDWKNISDSVCGKVV